MIRRCWRAVTREVAFVFGRYFRPEVSVFVVVVLVLGFGVTAWGVLRVQARLEAEGLRRELCAEKLKNMALRSAFVERLVRPENPCVALAIVEREP